MVTIDAPLLRGWPLPQPQEGGDKDDRGSVLVVGGSMQVPGALLLAGTAALRAGAGKLQMATCRGAALALAIAVPEALVVGLPESLEGDIDPDAAREVGQRAGSVRAVLIGPGMTDNAAAARLVTRVIPLLNQTGLVLDAGGLAPLASNGALLHDLQSPAIVTPHAGEMATMLGLTKEEVTNDPLGTARRAATELRAVVALKGTETFIVAPDGATFCNRHGTVGLAVSGSGDTLAGIIVGLLARGATPLQATVWGVFLHASAGAGLARRMGTLGFLARELPGELPALLSELGPS